MYLMRLLGLWTGLQVGHTIAERIPFGTQRFDEALPFAVFAAVLVDVGASFLVHFAQLLLQSLQLGVGRLVSGIASCAVGRVIGGHDSQ